MFPPHRPLQVSDPLSCRGEEGRSDPRQMNVQKGGEGEHRRPPSGGPLSLPRYPPSPPPEGRAAGEGTPVGAGGGQCGVHAARRLSARVRLSGAAAAAAPAAVGRGAGRAVRRRFPLWRAQARSCQGPARRVGRCGSRGRWRAAVGVGARRGEGEGEGGGDRGGRRRGAALAGRRRVSRQPGGNTAAEQSPRPLGRGSAGREHTGSPAPPSHGGQP